MSSDSTPGRTGAHTSFVLVAVFTAVTACKGAPDLPQSQGRYAEVAADRVLAHVDGPPVRLVKTGPARFVRSLYDEFDVERAMVLVGFMDARVRTSASRGFDEVQDELAQALRAAGYGAEEGLELEEIATSMAAPSWQPVRARAALLLADGTERILHAFSDPAGRDRCMLPRSAPSASIRGRVAFALETLNEGDFLVTKERLHPDLVERARVRGAIGIASASLASYNVDPSGQDRHLDAIESRELPPEIDLPVVQISERSYAQIEEAVLRSGSVELLLEAEIQRGTDRLRTLVATVAGSALANEAVVVVSHVEEPGASDNASGAAGALECALTLARLMKEGSLPRPDRSLVFVWGIELGGSEAWLAHTALRPVAMIDLVMAGSSRARTGAMPLLERHPDPGALQALPPDRHSSRHAPRAVEPAWLERQNGLALIGRCALVDVSLVCGGWETSENPYEGGSDHELFIQRGIPAVRFWHFTDFTFGTSLDRLEMVDGEELRRTSVAALATALCVASPEPADLDRFLQSNQDELSVRREAALAADESELAEAWARWCTGVRHWFRWLCLGAELPARPAAEGEPAPPDRDVSGDRVDPAQVPSVPSPVER